MFLLNFHKTVPFFFAVIFTDFSPQFDHSRCDNPVSNFFSSISRLGGLFPSLGFVGFLPFLFIVPFPPFTPQGHRLPFSVMGNPQSFVAVWFGFQFSILNGGAAKTVLPFLFFEPVAVSRPVFVPFYGHLTLEFCPLHLFLRLVKRRFLFYLRELGLY